MNIAAGLKRAAVLQAEGEAESIRLKAAATAVGIKTIAEAVRVQGGTDAIKLSVAEQYVAAFGNIAKEGNTVLLPSDAGNPGAMVAQALAVYQGVGDKTSVGSGSSDHPDTAPTQTATQTTDADDLGQQEEGAAVSWLKPEVEPATKGS